MLFVLSVTFAQRAGIAGQALAPEVVDDVVAERVVRARFVLALVDLNCNKNTHPVSSDGHKIFILWL